MAARTCLTYKNGKLDVPEALQQEWQLRGGEQLRVDCPFTTSMRITDELAKDVKDIDWHVFEGCMSDLNLDLNAELDMQRIHESELDAHL